MPQPFCACPLCRAGADPSDPAHSYLYAYDEAPIPAAAQPAVLGTQPNSVGDPVLSGYVWQGSVTYSFATAATNYGVGYAEAANDFGTVSLAQQQAVRYVLEGTSGQAGGPVFRYGSFESVTLVSISEVAGPTNGSVNTADIRIAQSSLPNPTAYAYYPAPGGSLGYAGDVWFGTEYDYSNPVVGTYEWYAIIHELGHAFGLKHGHETDVYGALPADRDSLEFSVMTYRSYIGAEASLYTPEEFGGPQTLMMYDIAALQAMYGADYATNASNTTYRWNPDTGEMSLNGVGQGAPGGNRVFLTIWDGGGNDTYDFSNYTELTAGSHPLIDLRPGGWTNLTTQISVLDGFNGDQLAHGNIYNSFLYQGDARSYIENANGTSFDDEIHGNDIANQLVGGEGNDTLYGGDGVDTLYGNNGADSLYGGAANDSIYGGDGDDVLDGGAGNDYLNDNGTGNNTLYGGDGIDTVLGGNGADTLFGGAGNDELYGLNGDDVMDGGAGNDFLIDNGTGNDTYIVDSSTDGILDVFGHDLVRSSANFALGDLIEDLELVGPSALIGSGNGLSNGLFGSAFNNTLEGMGGDDSLFGGAGDDTLTDVLGNNTFYGGTGNDRMQAFSGDNVFVGDDGSDLMWGNTGNDVYHADRFDTVADSGGLDTVIGYGGGNFVMTAGIELMLVEGDGASVLGSNLRETVIGHDANDWIDGAGGNDLLAGWVGDDTVLGSSGDDTLHGNEGNDSLFGGADSDTLDGGEDADTLAGGAGDDTLFGWFGDDRLLGDDGNDTLVETAGTNVMQGAVGNDLAFGGSGADTFFGDVGDDIVVANEGDDYLDGSAGIDTFWGGAGSDTIYGGDDTDFFLGGGGGAAGDTMYGGGGDDLFYFSRGDGVGNRIYNSSGDDAIVAVGGYAYNAAGEWAPGPGISDNSGGTIGNALGGAGSGVSIAYGAGNVFTLDILGSGAASITADADEVQRIVLWNSDNPVPEQQQELFVWNGSQFAFMGYDA